MCIRDSPGRATLLKIRVAGPPGSPPHHALHLQLSEGGPRTSSYGMGRGGAGRRSADEGVVEGCSRSLGRLSLGSRSSAEAHGSDQPRPLLTLWLESVRAPTPSCRRLQPEPRSAPGLLRAAGNVRQLTSPRDNPA
eukprot:9922618-Alexandrium_andersonii.AAC.1